ncbi:sugar ABC transporter permease [Microbacterium sp. zg-Y818]|uniref:carbohydrate ABC transporter permease n=1 Tax=unclassified Microbacterium TaxID=2609290 RepID=UPI00214BFCFC|nr:MULTISPECIES: sugar ABC transporter permease [unclassified Microbacterium]MCR2802028.1 sugar ABC transporter permease [Microbacterium sp. zg.Y818]WIM22580.1 sugar ABC transporter permease [Microbacterium sp. zg-Y818]
MDTAVTIAVRAPRVPRRRRPSGASLNALYIPALVLFAVFTVYPLISGLQLSFTDWNGYSGERAPVGLANYARLLEDLNFRTALANTFVYGIGSAILQQVLGLGLALALNRVIPGRGIARTIIYLPVLVSPIVMGTMYYQLFRYKGGALNDIAEALGGSPVLWLSDATLGMIVIVAVNSLQFVGISMVIYLAGLQAVPHEYYEAAALDGAGPWQRFRHITLPLLQPAFATSMVLNLIGGLKLFDVITVMTGGGPGNSTHSVSSLLAKTYFDNQSAGYASAMGVVLFAIIAVLTIGLHGALNRKQVQS